MDSRFREDLGADSLDAVEIIMQIEEEFGVEIAAKDITEENFRNKEAIVSLVKMLLEDQ